MQFIVRASEHRLLIPQDCVWGMNPTLSADTVNFKVIEAKDISAWKGGEDVQVILPQDEQNARLKAEADLAAEAAPGGQTKKGR
jgi:hypothetical protein